MITINATQLSEGIDYSTFLSEYYAGLAAGASTYHGGDPVFAFGGYYYVTGPQVSFDFGDDSDKMVLLEGEDISYDFLTYGAEYGHGISGEVDTVVFGVADENTTTADGTENGLVVGLTGLVVSGLDVSSEPGSGNDYSNLVYALYNDVRYGLNDAETIDHIADLYATFASDAQHFLGTNYNDVYTGTGYGDLIEGFNGDDVLYGGAGEDRMFGDRGADVMYGGNANDILYGDAGNDSLYGGAGADSLYGNGGDDYIEGGNGHDLIGGFAGHDELWGGAGNDTIMAGGGNDTVEGEAGNDVIYGKRGNDLLFGGDGNDRIFGDEGNDTINGGDGADGLFGGAGADVFTYFEASESYLGSADNLRDFEAGVDTIDLSAFDLVFVDEFTGAGDEVTFVERSDRTSVQADIDGDGSADLYIVVHTTGLTENDLLLA
ncbi:calcium-binding protein [Acuticoccus sediminis]|uniref:calcium-binding protein n=1 Tax=Acuticoccus sediminis TaxID=2184697 RepID=UPI001CFEF37A|nr:calcium-binding protein [Acuticoccus sediminis]